MAFSTTRKCFGRYVYITTDIRSCLSATPTFVCFSIMEVRIGSEMCTTRPDTIPNKLRRRQRFDAGTQSYTRYMYCLLKASHKYWTHCEKVEYASSPPLPLTCNSSGCSFTHRNGGVVIPRSWMAIDRQCNIVTKDIPVPMTVLATGNISS